MNKNAEYERVGGLCHYCQTKMLPPRPVRPSRPRDSTWDHVVPKKMGGPDIRSNVVLCCKFCNERKGTMSYEEAWLYRPWELSKPAHQLLRRQLYFARSGNVLALPSMSEMCPLCQGDP